MAWRGTHFMKSKDDPNTAWPVYTPPYKPNIKLLVQALTDAFLLEPPEATSEDRPESPRPEAGSEMPPEPRR